jgi:hypothetical protein
MDETLSPMDPLEFVDQKSYPDRVKDSQEKTGMQDALRTGTGARAGRRRLDCAARGLRVHCVGAEGRWGRSSRPLLGVGALRVRRR